MHRTYHASIYARKQGAIGIFYWVDISFDTVKDATNVDLLAEATKAANLQGWEIHHIRKITREGA